MITQTISALERVTDIVGSAVATLVPIMAIVTLIIVIMRYALDMGSIALQESVLYMHGTFFMLGLAYALQTDSHVRVDIVYSRMPPHVKRWVNLCGHVFLLIPLAVVLIVYSWDYVFASWRVRESSPEVGGIPGIYLLKSLIPVSSALLIMQALCEITRMLLEFRKSAD